MRQEQVLFIVFMGGLLSFIFGFVFQKHLPPPKPTIIGVDLGTTFSCVGAFQAGSGERLVFHPEDNKTTIPSIVAFTPTGILVGREARRQAEVNPENTLFDAKRFIGKSFSGMERDKLQAIYPFHLVRRSNGSINFLVKNAENTPYGSPIPQNIPLPSLPSGQKQDLTTLRLIAPEEVGAIIISRLKEAAEKELTSRFQPVSVHRAVISVPADFDQSQRNATRWAAEIAGLEVMRIVSEPTAAALAYGVDKEPGTSLVLVVDLGGGTLDVSLLRKRNGMFWVLGMAGDNRLGGQDFNRNLKLFLGNKLADLRGGKPITDPGDLQRLSEECEKVKIELSTIHEAEVNVEIEGEKTYNLKVTRDDFEMVNKMLFKRVLLPIDAAIEMGEIKHSEVDSIVLVGGSTRVPRVRELISGHFGGKEVDTRVDPELAVTIGVSIQAGVIGGTWPVPVSAVELPMKDGKISKIQLGTDEDDL
ncbi:hypothetical protein AAMO2058_001304000 [Amorphochlora amoebiformis]|uniref:Uncharacterized protein n=1 Tax=Amorphochlora amoebiformis TaxID=1561963 RepID=A0A6T6UWA7_9EUKA